MDVNDVRYNPADEARVARVNYWEPRIFTAAIVATVVLVGALIGMAWFGA